MFASVYIENYRNLADGLISLKNRRGSMKQAVFVFGENGVGKTSFIRIFSFLKRSCDALVYNSRVIEQSKESELYSVCNEVGKHIRFGSSNDLVIIYEIMVDTEVYIYSLVFTPQGDIHRESLIRKSRGNCSVLFSLTPKGLYMNEKIMSKRSEEAVAHLFEKYRGYYTILSVYYLIEKNATVHLKKNFRRFLHRIGKLHVQEDGLNHAHHQNVIEEYGVSTTEGYVDDALIQYYRASAIVITQIAKSIYPEVDHVRYEFKREGHLLSYHLESYIRSSCGIVEWKQDQQPSSYIQLLDFCTVLMDSYLGYSVVYDDIGRMFSPESLKFLIKRVIQRTGSQLIVTTKYPTLLNHLEARSIYIIRKDGDYVRIAPLEDNHVVRENHNIRKRYEEGVYNHYNPVNPRYNHYKLMSWFEEHIKIYKQKIKGNF